MTEWFLLETKPSHQSPDTSKVRGLCKRFVAHNLVIVTSRVLRCLVYCGKLSASPWTRFSNLWSFFEKLYTLWSKNGLLVCERVLFVLDTCYEVPHFLMLFGRGYYDICSDWLQSWISRNHLMGLCWVSVLKNGCWNSERSWNLGIMKRLKWILWSVDADSMKHGLSSALDFELEQMKQGKGENKTSGKSQVVAPSDLDQVCSWLVWVWDMFWNVLIFAELVPISLSVLCVKHNQIKLTRLDIQVCMLLLGNMQSRWSLKYLIWATCTGALYEKQRSSISFLVLSGEKIIPSNPWFEASDFQHWTHVLMTSTVCEA